MVTWLYDTLWRFGAVLHCCVSQDSHAMVMHWPSVGSKSMVMPGGRPESAHRLRNPMVVEDVGDALAM